MIAYCGGTFDLLHPGHLAMLEWAKNSYGQVAVALNTDEFVEEYKGARPIMTYEERWKMVNALRYVDIVIPNYEGKDSRLAITGLRLTFPSDEIIIVNGSDWTEDRLMKQMSLTKKFLQVINARIVLFPYSMPLHTTDIKKRIK